MAQRSRIAGAKRPSVYDVARLAGVSIATVSRVLRDSAPVATHTRRAVLAAADELGWRPSRLARAFVAQSHGAVGIVFPERMSRFLLKWGGDPGVAQATA